MGIVMFCLAWGTQRRLVFFTPYKLTSYCIQKQKVQTGWEALWNILGPYEAEKWNLSHHTKKWSKIPFSFRFGWSLRERVPKLGNSILGQLHPPTHTSTINFANSPTQRSIIYQDKREGSGQGSLPKAESVCGLVSYISGPVNQSVLNQLLQLHDCNWSSFLRDRLLRSRSGDKHRFSRLCIVTLHLPLDKAP